MIRAYDTSIKQYEVLRITYRYDKYSRKLINKPTWEHYRYYKTMEGALDAARDLRHSFIDKAYYDYPALFSGAENEKKYPFLTPTISIYRYKAVHRDKTKNT